MHKKTVADNGLRILTTEMPHTQSASVVLYVGAGSRYEVDEVAGASHFVEHMCFKGTRRRPTSKEISEAIEGVGGVFNAATDRELTSYWCKVPIAHLPLALDVMADIVRDPLFEPEEVEKERYVILEELSMSNDIPSYRAELLIDEVMWPNQPLGRDVGGSKETVTEVSRKALMEYMHRQYTTPNLVVSVAGNISHDEVIDAVAGHFRSWTSHAADSWFPAEDDQSAPAMKLENRKTEQAHLCIALKGLSSVHPDRYALDLLNTVLGEGMSSRLFLELREKQSLVYDVHTTSTHLRDCGSFAAYAGVDPKNAKRAIDSVLQELNRAKDPVPEEELHKAKEFLKGRLVLRMEDSRSVAAWLGAQEILLNDIRTVEDVLARVDAITPEDVQRVAKDVLVGDKLNLAVVGPFRSDKSFQASLKGLG